MSHLKRDIRFESVFMYLRYSCQFKLGKSTIRIYSKLFLTFLFEMTLLFILTNFQWNETKTWHLTKSLGKIVSNTKLKYCWLLTDWTVFSFVWILALSNWPRLRDYKTKIFRLTQCCLKALSFCLSWQVNIENLNESWIYFWK